MDGIIWCSTVGIFFYFPILIYLFNRKKKTHFLFYKALKINSVFASILSSEFRIQKYWKNQFYQLSVRVTIVTSKMLNTYIGENESKYILNKMSFLSDLSMKLYAIFAKNIWIFIGHCFNSVRVTVWLDDPILFNVKLSQSFSLLSVLTL